MTRIRYALPFVVLLVGVFAPARAVGAPPEDAERKHMRERFEHAAQSEKAEKYQEALGMLREVAAYKTTPGVLFHIANCEEHLGQLADALRDFEKADLLAGEQSVEDVRQLAKPRLAALDARVPRITLALPRGVSASEITVDGTAVASDQLAKEVRVDPGHHAVVVRATGRKAFEKSVDVNEHDAITISVELAPEAPASRPVAPASGSDESSQPRSRSVPTATWVAAGGAVALAAGGIVVFAVSGAKNSSASDACAASPSSCDRTVPDAVHTLDRLALGLWIGAGVAAGAAVAIWALDRPRHPHAPRASLHVTPTGALVRGTF